MMLDTDVCLAWGNMDLAKNSDCCAWWGVGENKICGTDRDKCCTKSSNCGSSPHFNGPAMFDIMNYIRSEDRWLTDFKVAWKKAVENGHTGLKPLQCPQPAILKAPGSLIEEPVISLDAKLLQQAEPVF